MEMAIQFHN